jgi:hypothetical protein
VARYNPIHIFLGSKDSCKSLCSLFYATSNSSGVINNLISGKEKKTFSSQVKKRTHFKEDIVGKSFDGRCKIPIGL